MKLYLFLCLSHALLCKIVYGHHGGPHDDDHDHQDYTNTESKAFLRIAPANVMFSHKFYSHLAATYPDDNLFFSPLSISTAMSMLALGAKSKSLSEIREGLCFNTSLTSEETINNGFQQIAKIINQLKSDLQLNSANAVFIGNNLKAVQKFLDDTKNFFQSEAISVDFHKAQEAVSLINSYVEKKTNGKIKDLLDSLDPLTALVIVNTIYFKGSWEEAFNVNHTREEDFHVNKNTVVKVQMMTRKGKYLTAFLDEIGCTVVEVPYKGNTSAIFVLPNEGKLHEVEKALQNVSLVNLAKQTKQREIIFSIPRFTMSTKLDLLKELPHLGIKEIFSDHAELSGITEEVKLKVSKAVHQAELDVNEEGTEAAAATALGVTKLSLPPQVKAKHPFIFCIISKITESIVFIGRVMNPAK
ncbi:alpha-1-antitrypsin-like [Leptodactylus fuscus]|uniref:alpha-1-antitrypsin-like n=1 Tax=Leptodactylus fuscus TaxID=238119 RepID=UPI003F4EC389